MLFSQNSSPLEKVFIFLLFSFARFLGRQIVLPASSPIIIVLLFLRNQRFGPSPDIGIGAQVVIKHLIGVGRICVQHVYEYGCVRLFSKSVCLGLTWPNRPPLLKWLRWDAFWFSLSFSVLVTSPTCWPVMSFPTKRPYKAFEWRKPWLARESEREAVLLSEDERLM